MSYRLLHLADIHLDRSFAGLGCHGELARRRRQGLRDALRRAGELAREHRCQAVTIAGDLFEHERAGVDTERFLSDLFASWRPLRVFIAPGNHDAFMPGSLYRRADWPDNVHVFTESHFEPVPLDAGLTLWGLAHREPAWREDPLAGAEMPEGEGVNLALFHGSELGSRPEGKPAHGPFRAEEIRARGFNAALCGHYHRRRVDGANCLLYPGSLEPLTFDEPGEHGPVVVDVSAGGAVGFEPLQSNRWWMPTVSCDLEGCTSTARAVDAVEAACRSAVGTDPDVTMVRVDLTGSVAFDVPLDATSLETAVRDRLPLAHIRVRDLTDADVDEAALLEERSTRGAFVRAARAAMERAADEEEAAVLADALRYGLMALAGAEVGVR